mgnify:CR=1 FL=1
MTRLATPRLDGHPVARSDAGFLAALFGRAEVGHWTGESRAPWTAAEAARRAEGFAAHWAAHGFGLRVWREGAAPVALAGLQFCVIDGRAEVELSFAVSPERQGEGLAREAAAAALAEAPGIAAEVAAVTWADNAPALTLLAALGFREARAAGARRLLRLRTRP